MEWPKPDDKLFTSAEDWPLNACVNCYRPDIGNTADHYNVSAKALSRAAAEGDVTLDQAIIPIAFLYRQYIELSLKQMIAVTRQIENQGSDYPQHHNLKNLWAEAKRLLIVHYGDKRRLRWRMCKRASMNFTRTTRIRCHSDIRQIGKASRRCGESFISI